ncbi:LytR/AlgR family response regulator transcription factor [Enterovibrio paralichthyis]|uniref:LytR/AlgR family response regulator transcription factor n=1 Tax=Enterovibrio paralichthyis TaxID=2853805 RepID=UPI001C46045A|nr:LytTR family DNA-binding domain-containing protein [Enterovibrio paralichthyis]MBV7298439.1 LytTR family DNA-binding domain-containing protein [Enterovibrio paralichthyis]
MRVIIADDEPLLRHHLSKLLEDISSEIEVVACAKDGVEAVDKIKEQQPDAVFLDIRMPGLDGLEVACTINALPKPPRIVFITAYDHYAIEAFEQGALDYLVKPINEDRLEKTCQRLLSKSGHHGQVDSDQLIQLLEHAQEKRTSNLTWLKAAKGDDIHLVHVDDVEYFRAEDKYVTVVTKENEFIIRTPLKNLVRMLDEESFWQIHRSVIVKVSAIGRVSKDITGRMHVEVASTLCKLPVSRNAHSLFKQM